MALMRKKSVDQIVKPLAKIVAELNDYAAFNAAEGKRHNDEAVRHTDLQHVAQAEQVKAENAAAKIASLFS